MVALDEGYRAPANEVRRIHLWALTLLAAASLVLASCGAVERSVIGVKCWNRAWRIGSSVRRRLPAPQGMLQIAAGCALSFDAEEICGRVRLDRLPSLCHMARCENRQRLMIDERFAGERCSVS